MTDDRDVASIPVAGSLSAKIIRKCPTHDHCPLDCKYRQVEDLGQIASFDSSTDPSFLERVKQFLKGDS